MWRSFPRRADTAKLESLNEELAFMWRVSTGDALWSAVTYQRVPSHINSHLLSSVVAVRVRMECQSILLQSLGGCKKTVPALSFPLQSFKKCMSA